MEKKVTNLENLTKYGYEEYPNSFIKRINGDWIIRIDKHTKKLKYWDSADGIIADPTPYIQDLIQAGIVI